MLKAKQKYLIVYGERHRVADGWKGEPHVEHRMF